jgi:hypothetical protein
MERTPKLSVPYLLRKLLAQGEEIVSEHHPWLWEHNRWKELVFCILSQSVEADQPTLRSLTDHLDSLGLIHIEFLASLQKKDDSVSVLDNPDTDELANSLFEQGFDEEAIEKSIISLTEVAAGLQNHFNGKVQLYLRQYGELLLRDLPNQFHFTHLQPIEARRAFIFWMQNVLTLPLSMENPAMQRFAIRHDIEPNDLIQAADDMGLNVSLLDDLIEHSESVER